MIKPIFITQALMCDNDLGKNNLIDDNNVDEKLDNVHMLASIEIYIGLFKKDDKLKTILFPTFKDLEIFYLCNDIHEPVLSDINLSALNKQDNCGFSQSAENKYSYVFNGSRTDVDFLSYFNTIHLCYPLRSYEDSAIEKYNKTKEEA